MKYVRDEDQKSEIWRSGVETRMFISAATGSSQLTVFEQWCDPDEGAPTHTHPVEEVLRVIDGYAEIWVEDYRREFGPGESVIIPAGEEHGFVNYGPDMLHTLAILASPVFEAFYTEEGRSVRRWDAITTFESSSSAS